ncbi:MAG: TRAP transporter small permease subunit [Rhodospirillales bacterium]
MTIRHVYFLYLYPQGRIGRLTMLAGLAPLFLAGIAVHLVIPLAGPAWFFFDCFLFMFAMVLASKRCLDRGRPTWFLFLGLAPVAWLVITLDPKIEFLHREAWIALALYGGWLTAWLAAELFVLPGRPSDEPNPREISLAGGIDAFVDVIGRVVAWICIAQVALVGVNVILRYMLRIGPMELQELEWHMISPIALIGMCYAMRHNDHVKVDIFYDKFEESRRDLVDMFAAIATIVISVLIIELAVGFVGQAYVVDEGSPDPGGLPHRWLLRSFIPVGFAILAMQAFGNLIKMDVWALIRRRTAS